MTTPADKGGPPGRERLIESHLPLVRSIARRYEGRGEPQDDLVQAGAIALVRASDRFDPDRGVSFASYATPAIEGEIRRHLGERSGSVRIPREVRRMSRKLEHSRAELAATLGRAPTLEELARTLGVEQEDVVRALQAERALEPSSEVSDDVAEAATQPASLQSTDDRLMLAAGSHVLDERERRIVVLRFHADMTEREIAREVGISQAQVSRLLSRALAKLREELDDKNLVKRTGDITQMGGVSAEKSSPEGVRSRQRRSPASSETAETRIVAVGALDEQAQPAAAPQARPDGDLALPYRVTVKAEGEGPGSAWVASFEELPGSTARGATPDQAVENLRSAMEAGLSAAASEPQVISPPKRTPKRKKSSSHSGRFLVRMPSELHEELTRAAEREDMSLNRFVTSRLAASVGSPGSAGSAAEEMPAKTDAAEQPRRSLRFILAANVVSMILAGAAAIVLLILALERGV